MKKLYTRALVAASTLAVAAGANAAVDTTSLTAASTDITSVGVAVFAVIVGIKGIKWVRRAL